MSFLLDTNILLRLVQPGHPMCWIAINAISSLRQQQEPIWITPQILIEFWAVATRPIERNGLGISVEIATQEVNSINGFFPLKPDIPDVFPTWQKLVVQHQVVGKQVHDTRLVALMIAHQIPRLLTFNSADFKRFPQITAIDPQTVLT
ncbi:MAG: PIN domain-containing protein [Cyanobacteriota bacterium]